MRNIFNKTNVPYLVAGALATLTLLASGVFAVAPYIGFLAPVAALSVGLPFIIGCAVFSVVTIALSYKAISKNKTISEKDVQLAEKVEEISKKDAQLAKEEDKVQAQKQTISGQNDQLTKKEAEVKAKEEENSKQKIEINKKNEEIDNQKKIEELKHKKTFVPQAMKNIKEASQEVFAYVAEAYSSGRVHSTIKQRRSDVANDLKNVVGSAKNAYGTSVEYVKGKFNSAGNKLKNVYGISVGYTMGTLELAKKTLGSIGGSTKEEKNVATENLSGLKVVALSYVATNTTIQKDPEISSPESQPAEKEETKVSGYFNQVVSTANWLTSQATKAMPYLAASYLPYVFYNYAITPVSASFDDVNVTQSFVANSGITSPLL